MPLLKKPAEPTASQASTATLATQVQATVPVADGQAAQVAPRRIGGTRTASAKAAAPLTKEGYWDRKELRDIENSHHQRRAGAYQAALQSTGLLQLNTGNTLEAYLQLVEQAALRCVAFVEKE